MFAKFKLYQTWGFRPHKPIWLPEFRFSFITTSIDISKESLDLNGRASNWNPHVNFQEKI